MPVSNTHFEQCVKYKAPNLERIKLRIKELKNPFSSLKSDKSPGYDDISSNVIKSVSEEIFGVLKQVLDLSVNQGVLAENMKFACVNPIFERDNDYFLTNYRSYQYSHVFQKY